MQLGAGMAVAPGIVIHVVLGSLFALFLYRNTQSAAV
jgi:integral membrane sensor domain MASE1